MDLAIRGRIDTDLKGLWISDKTPTDSEILNQIMAEIAGEPQKLDIRSWIRRLMPRTVLAGLAGNVMEWSRTRVSRRSSQPSRPIGARSSRSSAS
jgi:hypothetical protein